MRRGGPGSSGLRRYLRVTSTPSFGIAAVLPLLALYEVGIRSLHSKWRNGADYYLKEFFRAAFPQWSFWIWWAGVALAALFAIIALARRRIPFFEYLALIAMEGICLGVVLGPLTLLIHHLLLPASSAVLLAGAGAQRGELLQAVLLIGAGVYEELVFRLLLLSLIHYLIILFLAGGESGSRLRRGRWTSAALAVVISSVIFSWFHHIGPGAEEFAAARFAYRAVGGGLLGLIFITRGFASVVYTHASYNLLVIFFFPVLQS